MHVVSIRTPLFLRFPEKKLRRNAGGISHDTLILLIGDSARNYWQRTNYCTQRCSSRSFFTSFQPAQFNFLSIFNQWLFVHYLRALVSKGPAVVGKINGLPSRATRTAGGTWNGTSAYKYSAGVPNVGQARVWPTTCHAELDKSLPCHSNRDRLPSCRALFYFLVLTICRGHRRNQFSTRAIFLTLM